MSDDYKIQNSYEGGECQMQYTIKSETLREVSMELPKPNYNIKFSNAEGYEVGAMDFNGPGLSFEGVADESAIVFMNWVANIFSQRLKEERNNEREALLKSLLALKKGTAGPTEYIQGRWDLIGEFEDVILNRIEK